jgi:hypothetical protein
LSLLTHGLQGLGGTRTLNLLLIRQVSDEGHEGVTDAGYQTLHYAYLPHAGNADDTQPWLAAYSFNQPLISVWRAGEQLHVQLLFLPGRSRRFAIDQAVPPLPTALSLMAADSAIVADLYRRDDQVEVVILDAAPATPALLICGGTQRSLPMATWGVTEVELRRSNVRGGLLSCKP